jgi:DNA-binding NarL/FixJ family response regulator
MTGDIKILLVDDHALVRGALAERLQLEPRLLVVGTAETADEAIKKALERHPDIIVMDIDMPGMVCFEAARMLTKLRPETKIIFLSAFTHDHYIEQALKVRARGYLTKNEPPEKVIEAILEVASGGAYYSDEVQARIVVDSKGAGLLGGAQSRIGTLGRRELETLRYIAHGLTKKRIAEVMSISVKTVEQHTLSLMSKLAIHDRVELARFAIREGVSRA